MRVLLINPPIRNMLTTEVPEIVTGERGFNPPLGIMYIAACLERDTDCKVEILDAEAEELDYGEIRKEVIKRKPDIVGLSAMTFTLVDCLIIAKIVKDTDKTIEVILGGIHAYIYPHETINLPCIDYLIVGEGEFISVDWIKNIDKIEKLKKIKGLVFKDGGRIIHTGLPPLIEDLDDIPFPSRHLTPYKKYSSLLAKRSPITTMITSRGCPYKCTFCMRPHLGKKFRARSAKNVVNEIQECVNMGIKEFLMYDDTFTIGRKRVVDICNEIMRRKLDIGWDIRARVDTVDYELLKKLKRAGCERIHYGVEKGNQEQLNILKKGITLRQVEDVFKITRKARIDILAYFMIGGPNETRETVMQSINFAKKIKPDFVHFSITTPFPSTELYTLALQRGIIKKDVWKEFAKNPTIDFRPPLWEDNLTRKQMIGFLKYAYKEFYTRPGYILNKISKIRSLGEFQRKVRAGLKIFRI